MKIFITAALLLIVSFNSYACDEKVEIDSVKYDVGAYWCGNKIDTTLLAEAADLVRLPENLCFNDYKIYVRPETKKALMKMAEEAAKDSVYLQVKSGFRSARYQKVILRRKLAEGGNMKDLFKLIAPPGYSQHETGYALDMATDSGLFKNSASYKWLKKHGEKFGFYETYPYDGDKATPWEPWHWYYKPD